MNIIGTSAMAREYNAIAKTGDRTRRNRMTGIIAALCVVLTILIMLAGCGSRPFNIEGSWTNVSSGKWGQVTSEGTVVNFRDGYCNLFSPRDTYALKSKDDGGYSLTVTGLLGMGETFDVNVQDDDHITLTHGSTELQLERAG